MAESIEIQAENTLGPRHRFDALTSMRFIAAGLVFLHHCEGKFGIPFGTFPYRRYSVTFFFVLSAFMLVAVYHNRQFTWRRFMAIRFARIVPLHLVAFVATVACFWKMNWIAFQRDAIHWINNTVSQILLIQCWHPRADWVFTGNGVTWSLCVLVFFYALFPFLLKLRRYLWILLFVAIALSLGMLKGVSDLASQTPGFYDPITVAHIYSPLRLVEFLVGMLAAQVYLAGVPEWLTQRTWLATFIEIAILLLVLVGWAWVEQAAVRTIRTYPSADEIVLHEGNRGKLKQLQDDPLANDPGIAEFLPYSTSLPRWLKQDESGRWFYIDRQHFSYVWIRWFRYVGFALPAALMILWFTVSDGWISRLLRHPWLVASGLISYAVFLVHVPVIRSVEVLSGGQQWPWPVSVLVSFLAVIGISVVLYRMVEQPARKSIRRWLSTKDERPRQT